VAENSLTDYAAKGLRGMAEVMKHNDLSPGVPDLSVCVRGGGCTRWVEAKAARAWPARAATPLRFPHYTELQALFLRRRGGFLFVRVGKTYLLYRAPEAWALWEAGGWARAEMLENAARVWHGGVRWREFLEELVR